MNKVHEDASKGIEKTDVESSKERPLIISSPNQGELRHRKSHNTVKLQRAEVSQVNTSQEDVVLPQSTNTPRAKKMPYTQNQLFEIYRILGCVLIAFVSRMVLKTGYGLFYFKVSPPCFLIHLSWRLKWVFLITICLLSVLLVFVIVVVNFSYFHLFLHNHRANFNQTWLKHSLVKEI